MLQDVTVQITYPCVEPYIENNLVPSIISSDEYFVAAILEEGIHPLLKAQRIKHE